MPPTPTRRGNIAAVGVAVALLAGVSDWSIRGGLDGGARDGGAAPSAAPPAAFSSGFREGFLKEGQASCTRNAKASVSREGLNIPDERLGAHCACYFTNMSDTFTPNELLELSRALQDGKAPGPPPALRGRMEAVLKTCGRELL